MKRPKKAYNIMINKDFLFKRISYAKKLGYEKQKWVYFCECMMDKGYTLHLYEAQRTVSKYVTVSNGIKSFKVRFSNHAPILEKEKNKDCDFFVGVTNFKVSSTENAIEATLEFFKNENPI